MSVTCKYSPGSNGRGARRRKREGNSSTYRDVTRSKSNSHLSSAPLRQLSNPTSKNTLDGTGEAVEQIWSFLEPMDQDTTAMAIDHLSHVNTSRKQLPSAPNVDDTDLFSEISFSNLTTDFDLPDVDDFFVSKSTSLLSQSKMPFPRLETAFKEPLNVDALACKLLCLPYCNVSEPCLTIDFHHQLIPMSRLKLPILPLVVRFHHLNCHPFQYPRKDRKLNMDARRIRLALKRRATRNPGKAQQEKIRAIVFRRSSRSLRNWRTYAKPSIRPSWTSR